MKQNFIVFMVFVMAIIFAACNNSGTKTTATGTNAGNMTFPYVTMYPTDYNNDVSDSDLLLVLNSYKDWETGDLTALRSTMGDSMSVNGANGFKFYGLTDSLMPTWTKGRDSISSIAVTMYSWDKIHSLKDSGNFVNAWYKEIDTYKTGRVDSANFSDINEIKNGKITWYTSFRQQLK